MASPERGLRLAGHRLADHRLADHRLADHRLADHRLTDHRLADYRLTDYRLTDYRLTDRRLTDHRLANYRLDVRRATGAGNPVCYNESAYCAPEQRTRLRSSAKPSNTLAPPVFQWSVVESRFQDAASVGRPWCTKKL